MPKHKENFYEVSKEQAKYMHSINTKQDDRFTVELKRMPSEAVNIENRVEACESYSRTIVERSDFLETEKNRRTTSNNRIYENLVCYQNGTHILKSDLELENKTLILNKFFRSTERNYAAYENLCNGCGYGVFEARGNFCNFCQYVVHGAYDRRQSSNREEDHHSNGNIYENICDKCGTIYSSEECECCSLVDQQQELISKDRLSIDEKLDSAKVSQCKLVKKKRDKKSIFYGLIGSLRRVKNNLTPPQTPSQNSPDIRKRLEIVHNVDGYDNVFRTQESFDLEKICELKRTQNSCSDQHIYGRLKQRTLTATESFTLPTTLSQSHDQLIQDRWKPIEAPKQVASADCINLVEQTSHSNSNLDKKSKRPRISKPRLLRSRSYNKAHKSASSAIVSAAPAKQALYLADNVCQWMTSLRREIHNYQSFGLVDDIAVCDPKSIPARNTLLYGQTCHKHWAPALVVTNCQNIHKNIVSRETEKFCEISKVCDNNNDPCNWGDIVILRRAANDLQRSPVARSRSQQMVQDFKRNLMSQQREALEAARSLTPTTAPTTPTFSSTTMKTSPTSAQQRAKRQAIYLKLDDTPSNSSNEIANSKNSNNNNNNNNIHTDAKANYSSKQLVVKAASQLASDHGLVSRSLALQPNTAPNKRCGIYERDSEFVNDILCAFEQFLQREADTKSDNTILSAEVVAKRELSGDQPQTETVEQSVNAACVKSVHSKTEAVSGVINLVGGNRVLDLETSSVIVNDFQAVAEHALNKHQVALPDCHCNIVQPFVAVTQPVLGKTDRGAFEQIFNVSDLISNLLLSRCLNSIVVYYDKPLSAFLRCLRDRVEYREKYSGWTAERLVRKYQRFASYCQTASYAITQQTQLTSVGIPKKLKLVCDSVEQDAELLNIDAAESEVNCCVETESNLKSVNGAQVETASSVECQNNSDVESTEKTTIDQKNKNVKCHNAINSDSVKYLTELQECQSIDCRVNKQTEVSAKASESELPKKPSKPRVPQRDPATCITQRTISSPTRPIKRTSPIVKRRLNKMTVPTPNPNCTHPSSKDSHHNPNNSIAEEKEEDIYQPIWKFKTVGEVQERYHTDADYYEYDSGGGASSKQPLNDSSMANEHPTILISNDVEDHGEWETDDEFMFTTQLEDCCPADIADTHSLNSSTVRSTRSGSSITGSTVTGYASSSMTIASAVSASLMHHVFRNIGIFYSLSEPKLRAIIYDYDRVFATSYFAKRQTLTPASSNFEKTSNDAVSAMQECSPIPPPRTSSASITKASDSPKSKRNFPGSESSSVSGRMPAKLQLLPDSVQAWKFMLLDVNYLEDEEDMIVSESEILRAQEHKDDIDTRQNQQLHFLQRFKSASIGNLIDIPTEEDKKSITERMRNKLQRGVFKLNVRSPKSEKKSRGLFRRAEATSLYLEDGMKPKYPIFGAPLDQLELNQTTQPNVPRFVVDCVKYLERKDCIAQDGLYRASGNKVSIDELKQKLSESYIYDPRLLVCDDIHTLTSLLKQFFRELGTPLIPQETYERLGRNLTDDAAIETMRIAFDEMREPNRSTLKFLIKHLTNVASYSSENRMPASNLAIVWGPCILSANQIEYDIARMNTLAKVLIENYDRIFSNNDNERLVC